MFFKDADPKGKKAADAACRAGFHFLGRDTFCEYDF